jgi:hypothetical protein
VSLQINLITLIWVFSISRKLYDFVALIYFLDHLNFKKIKESDHVIWSIGLVRGWGILVVPAMVHHSSELHSLQGSSEVFQLYLVLVAEFTLSKDVPVDLTLNGFWLEIFNFWVTVVHIDPLLLISLDKLIDLMLNIELKKVMSILALVLWYKLKYNWTSVSFDNLGAHIFWKLNCQTGLALTDFEHKVIDVIYLV